ncbi:MAG: c-type cytochrome [Gemmatimonadetes bacterium]|nr:c-type cytochrome [Gemmatimonadota bacterium]
MRGLATLLLLLLAGCGADRPAAGGNAAAIDTAAIMALAEIPAATFDTVVWESESAAIARGADVFKWVCAPCHGPRGRGDGGYVIRGDTIHPPSFLEPDWRLANDPMGLRRKIYLGNNRGMPHWGERGMQARDVVALELFIRKSLRAPQGRGG